MENSDPFEMNHWEFYVVPTVIINRLFDDKDKISLPQVRQIAKQISYRELKSAIDAALKVE